MYKVNTYMKRIISFQKKYNLTSKTNEIYTTIEEMDKNKFKWINVSFTSSVEDVIGGWQRTTDDGFIKSFINHVRDKTKFVPEIMIILNNTFKRLNKGVKNG